MSIPTRAFIIHKKREEENETKNEEKNQNKYIQKPENRVWNGNLCFDDKRNEGRKKKHNDKTQHRKGSYADT